MTKEITIGNAQPGDVTHLANLLSQLGYPTTESNVLLRISAQQKTGYKILVAFDSTRFTL
jgi:hypothetical protein